MSEVRTPSYLILPLRVYSTGFCLGIFPLMSELECGNQHLDVIDDYMITITGMMRMIRLMIRYGQKSGGFGVIFS